MTSWRVLITDGLSREGLELLQRQAEVIETPDLGPLPQVEALIVRSRTRVRREDLSAASRLKVVGRAGVGVDNIDLEAARQTGVVVVNSPEAATVAVAEHTLGLMLALARQIPRADGALHRGEWLKPELWGEELAGKVLGLIGFGRIGQALGQRAAALGMRLLAHDPLLSAEAVRAGGAEPAPFDDLLLASDYVSLHLPLNEDTRGLMDREALAKVKRGARLISTARGGVVDEQALLEALESGRLAGAALDVFEHEPPPLTALLQHPRLVATPHIAAQTVEAQRRASIDIALEVLAALRGDPLRWRVA
ncbi:MAG: hydroxyacid dehydrogenase [Chloroflexota bacterium]